MRIPLLRDMYEDQPRYDEFVRLIVWFYNDDWDLAQRQWSRMLRAEYERLLDLVPPERIISELVARLSVRFAANYSKGKRYQPNSWLRRAYNRIVG
jgi:hypothetical protein